MEDKIKEISSLVAKYVPEKKEFVPGVTRINVSGKIFDRMELMYGVQAVLDGWWTEGRFDRQFKQKLSKFMGIKHIIPTVSGSSANLLALTALTSHSLGEKRLKPGDEVITVAAGFPTTINPILQNRCVPVFVDINLGTYNINTDLLEEALSEKTKAVMIAHTLGNPFNLKKVKEFCEKHNLWLVEDVCDALGSRYDGKIVGTFGDIATISLFPAHMITSGQGGVVMTNNVRLKTIIESFKRWGKDCYCESGCDNTCGIRFEYEVDGIEYDHKYIYGHMGYNLDWTDMQAAIASAQMEKLPGFIEKRKENWAYLRSKLQQFEDYLILPEAEENSDPAWFGFLLTVKKFGFTRKELTMFLEENQIVTRVLFGGNITRQPYFKRLEKDVDYRIIGDLKNSDMVMEHSFWIGSYPGITKEMIDYIAEKFAQFFANMDSE